MVYEWKQDRFRADAQKVGAELMAIGYRDAPSVVKAARKKPKGELHKCFEWDDSKAGEAYRLEQARLVLRMLVTVEEVPAEVGAKVQTYRAFESVRFSDADGKADKNMAYIPTREALSDPELRKQIIGRLEATISDSEKTAESYEYLVPSFGTVRERLQEARKAIRA